MRIHRFLSVAMLGLSLSAAEASAQTASTPSNESWQFQFVPYLWGSGLDGTVGIGDRTAEIDASFRNILDHLHFAAMGLADAHINNVSIVTDVFYTDLRGQRATPGPLFSSVSPQQKLFFMTPEAGYRVFNDPDSWLEVVGGVRLWHLSTALQFERGLLPAVDVAGSRTWVDAIVGLRAKQKLPGNWSANLYGDLGGGGSDFTFQVAGTATLDLHTRYAVSFGYRYLSVDYNNASFLMDTALRGPLVGFTFKF